MVNHSLHEKLQYGFISRKRTERYPAFLHYSSVMFLVFIRGSTDGPRFRLTCFRNGDRPQ